MNSDRPNSSPVADNPMQRDCGPMVEGSGSAFYVLGLQAENRALRSELLTTLRCLDDEMRNRNESPAMYRTPKWIAERMASLSDASNLDRERDEADLNGSMDRGEGMA